MPIVLRTRSDRVHRMEDPCGTDRSVRCSVSQILGSSPVVVGLSGRVCGREPLQSEPLTAAVSTLPNRRT